MIRKVQVLKVFDLGLLEPFQGFGKRSVRVLGCQGAT